MKSFLSIPNWDEFQHYKDRAPPWIKLHNQLLENYEFECLPDASKAHILCIWMLASRTGNKINPDPKWIARKIGANCKVDVDILIKYEFLQLNQELQGVEQDASNPLQGVEQDAIPEESRVEQSKVENKGRFTPPTFEEVRVYCQERKNNILANEFIDFYEVNGWMRGKSKIKDWKACVRTWEKNSPAPKTPSTPESRPFRQIPKPERDA